MLHLLSFQVTIYLVSDSGCSDHDQLTFFEG